MHLLLTQIGQAVAALHAAKAGPETVVLIVRTPDPARVVRVSHMGFVLRKDGKLVVRHASFGQEKAVIELPPNGTVNIHASILPALRGADPIRAAIRQGLAESGVSIMRMVPALDAGPVIHVLESPILSDETFGELEMRLAELGALALVEALALIETGAATETPQDDALATYAPKTERAHARVAWSAPAEDVARAVRAYDPRPGAFSMLRGGDVKLFGARAVPAEERPDASPGEVIALGTAGLTVKCGEDAVRLTMVQPAGKARMSPADWARGRGVELGDVFG